MWSGYAGPVSEWPGGVNSFSRIGVIATSTGNLSTAFAVGETPCVSAPRAPKCSALKNRIDPLKIGRQI